MRKEFVQCYSRNTARARCPWACTTAKVEGGFIAFEDARAAEMWRTQK